MVNRKKNVSEMGFGRCSLTLMRRKSYKTISFMKLLWLLNAMKTSMFCQFNTLQCFLHSGTVTLYDIEAVIVGCH